MKKIFTLIAAFVAAISVNAQEVVYSWESPDGNVVETGGKAECLFVPEGSANRLNYPNADYHTMCLNGKGAEMASDAPSKPDNATHIQITLDKALEAGDVINITAYLNKGEEKVANIFFDYGMGKFQVQDEKVYGNIGLGEQPTTHNYEVPAEAVGEKVIRLSRNASATNIFIIKFEIVRQSAGGGSTEYLLTEYKENTYAITHSAEDLVAKFGFAEGDNNFIQYNAGHVLLDNDKAKMEIATDGSYVFNKGYKMGQIKEENPEITACFNLGSALKDNQWVQGEIFIEDVAAIGKAWQGMIKVTPKVSGKLGMKVYAGDGTRTIGIWKVLTEAELDAEVDGLVAFYNFRHAALDDGGTEGIEKNAPATVEAEVEAGREYLLLGGGSKNMNLAEIVFIPAAGGADATEYLLTEYKENTYAITHSAEDLVAKFGFAEGDNNFIQYNAGQVLLDNDKAKMEIATDGSYVFNKGYKMGQIKEENPEITACFNLGSALKDNQWVQGEIFIEDVAAIGKAWQGMIKVTPKVAGKLGMKVYAGDGTRTIGIWKVLTEAELDAEVDGLVAFYNFRHAALDDGGTEGIEKNAPATVEADVEAGREYLLLGGGSKNMNLALITFVPGTSGIDNAIVDNAQKVVVGYYTINGVQNNGLVKGLNIVKFSDGSSVKVIK